MAKQKTSNKRKLKLKNPFITIKKKVEENKKETEGTELIDSAILEENEQNKKKDKPEKNINDKKLRKYKIRNFILIFFMASGITVISTIILFFLFIVITTEKFDPDKLLNREATVLYDINENEFARLGAENRDTVSYEDLPQVLIDAIVATEDARFFQHSGLDIARFAKASLGQVVGQQGAGGASTLTMQIAKMQFNGSEASGIKGVVRKFRDIYLSIFKIEKDYTKEQIIEFYVNTPGLGWQTYGVEQASQLYFGKSVKDLTLPEAALIAGIFNAPSAYNPFSNIELATQRRSTVLNLMVHHGYITEEERQDAEAISVESLLNPNPQIGTNEYQPFIDVVTEEVIKREGVDPATVSMQIYTTLDPELQDLMNALNKEELGYNWVDDKIEIAIAITSTKDGSILAVNGGRRYTNGGQRLQNLATTMKRHPGSTAKPLIAYGPYIEYNNGSPYSPFFDLPMTYSNGTPLKNAAGDYLGMLSMRSALWQSRNIPAVQAFMATDDDDIKEFVDNLHIEYGDEVFESMAIGGFDGVSPLDLSAAYAAFGRGGYYIEPYSFTKIVYTESGEEKKFKYEPEKAMSEETAYLINSMLVTASRYGVGGNLNMSGKEIGSKTGTSTYDYQTLKYYGLPSSAARDNWTCIYSPEYSMSVWYGYDIPMKDYYTTAMGGANQKTKITTILGNLIFTEKSKFEKPSGIVESQVELETFPAKLPSANTPKELITTEIFKRGTEPTEVSSRFDTLEAPTRGKFETNGSTVVLSWKGIDTPEAIDEEYLESFFNEYYTQWSEKYYKNRLAYNAQNIGTLGYQVYQESDNGLVSLGYTNSTSYSTTCIGECTFVIKSAYSIFKANMSDGLKITVNTAIPEEPEEPTDTKQLMAIVSDVCLPVSDNPYNDEEYSMEANPIIVLYDEEDVTEYATINRNVNILDRSTAGMNYTITYTISYNGKTTTEKRHVKISNSCSD